ncbi:MAG: RHS repeat domain-containing protein, partial [Gammaproteobacteria bacterium]
MHLRSQTVRYPFSLMTGVGLGVSHPQPLEALLPAQCLGQTQLSTYVNASNGNLMIQDRPFHFKEIGAPFSIGYVYNSLATNANEAWRLAAGREIKSVEKEKKLTVIEADGHEVIYTYHAAKQCYLSDLSNSLKTISFDVATSTYIYAESSSNTKEVFNQAGKLSKRIDAKGNTQTFHYNAAQRLTSVSTAPNAGYELDYQNGIIVLYKRENEKRTLLQRYLFDQQGRLARSETDDGRGVDYHYDKISQQLNSITGFDKTTLTFSYETPDIHARVSGVKLGEDTLFCLAKQQRTCAFIDANNVKTQLTLDDQDRLQALLTPAGETKLIYAADGQVKQVIYPDQSTEHFAYDPQNGLLTQHTTRTGLVTTVIYQTIQNKTLKVAENAFDPTSNSTTTTHFIYDEQSTPGYPRLAFKVSSVGRVTEYLYDNSTGLITGLRTYSGNVFRQMPTHGNLLTWKNKSDLTQTTLTTFKYDLHGRATQKTTFTAVDADGNGVVNTSMQTSHFVWDELDHIAEESTLRLASIDKDKLQTAIYQQQKNTYDAWDLLTETEAAVGSDQVQKTSHRYSENREIVNYADQHNEVAVLDARGLVMQMEEVAKKAVETINVKRDANGNITQITQEDGSQKHLVHDEVNQREYTISALGYVDETYHNSQFNYVMKKSYARPTNFQAYMQSETLSKPAFLQSLTALADSKDRQTYTFLDADQRERFIVDALNNVIEHRYNAHGQLIMQIAYAEKLSLVELDVLKQGRGLVRSLNRQVDRITATFYDQDQLKIAEQDAAGFITTYNYNESGHLVEKTQFSTPDATITTDFTQLNLSINNKDAHHYFINDAKGQRLFEIDAKGYVTAHTYYHDGNKKNIIQYANPVSSTWYDNTTSYPRIASHENDRQVSYHYDDLGRLERTYGPFDQVTTFAYDNMNRQIGSYVTDAKSKTISGDTSRGTEKKFDDLGCLIAEANPYLAEELKKIDESNTLLPDQKLAAKRALWDSQSTRHEYEHHLKVKSIDALGNVTRYFYDADHRLTLTIKPNGAMSETSYNAFGEIESERHYAAFCSEKVLASLQGGNVTPHLTSILDGLKDTAKDNVIRYTRNAKGHIEHKTDAELYTTSYEYNAFQECTLEVHPVSHQDDTLTIKHEYDNRGLEVKIQTIQAATGINAIVTRQFDHYASKETSVTNENGLTTTKEYDLSGQLETVTYSDSEGLSLSEQYAYDAFHRLVSATDASKHTTTTTYEDAQHKQVVTFADGTFKTITTNVFGEPIQIKNEAGDITLTTHTATGQQKTVTDIALGVKVTKHYDRLDRLEETVDGMGVKTKHKYSKTDLVETIEDADGLKLSTKFKVNAHGKNSEVADHNGIVTVNEFTRRGELQRQIRDKQGLKLTTENKFNAQGQKESTIQGNEENPNQYQLDLVHDGLGREMTHCIDPDIKDQKSHLAITQTATFSASGKPTLEIDPLGDKKWHIYDSLDRKRFSIIQQSNTEACLIGWEYTETGEVKSQRLYANPIKMADFPTKLTVKSLKQYIASDEDSLTLTLHNELKQPRFTLNATWDSENKQRVFQVSEQLFDATGNVSSTIQYANVFMAADGEPTHKNLLAFSEKNCNHTQNRLVRTLYNSQHRPLYHINASGQVTAFSYDLNNQPIEEREFYLPLSDLKSLHTMTEKALIGQLASLPKNNAKDKVTRTGFDALKRKTYEVDAIGRVKQYRYDANNNLTHIIERAEVLSIHTDSIEDRLTSLLSSQPNRSKDRIISRKYDAANRLVKEKDALGNVQEFIYDALGNQKKHIDRLGHTWEAEYDRAKRVTDKLSPEIAITEVKRNADGQLADRQVKTKVTKHFDYDAAGNKTKIVDGKGLADERTQAFSYYAQGRLLVSLTQGASIDNASAKADLNQLPVTTGDISLAYRHDARGREIACQHENGVWSATVYNHLGQPLYKISPEGAVTRYTYNAFGQPSEIYSYATPFKVTDAFLENNCSRMMLEAALTTHKDDRSIRCEYDADGLLTLTEKCEVFFYSNGEMGYGKPQHTQRHNRHKKVWHEATLIRPNTWADTYYWYDAAGQKIGELNPNKYLTLYTYDAFGQPTGRQEYAQPIAIIPEQHASFSDLKSLVTLDEKDRYYREEYDLAGNKIAELQENITVQEPAFSEHYIPGFKDVKVDACGKRFAYDAEGRLTETTHENGKTTKSFHNARGDIIAEMGIPFTREDEHRTLLTPLVTYGVNAFSQINKKTQHHANHNINVPADAESLAFDPDDLTELSLHDKRGLVQLHQNAEKKLKASTYTRSKKRAREFYATTTFIPNGKTQDLTNVEHHIDEKQFEYDAEDRTTSSRSLRDGVIVFQSHAKFNAFSDTIGEGVNGIDFPLYRKLDQNGNVFLSNAGNGAPVYTLRDLSGRDSMSLSSPSIDISHPDNLNPVKLISFDPSVVERSETYRDLCGFATHFKAPYWHYKNDNGFPTKYFVLDRWGNVVKEANAHGRTTENEYNHQNHVISTTTPETNVGNENGEQVRKRITTKNCYNLSGVLIGHIDGNGNAELYLLDEAGHQIEHVLGDGTRYQRNLFDIFERNDATLDPLSNITRRLFNRSHKISELIFPSGLRQIFTYDGADNRNSICHQLNSIHHSLYCFNFDINRNIIHLI